MKSRCSDKPKDYTKGELYNHYRSIVLYIRFNSDFLTIGNL